MKKSIKAFLLTVLLMLGGCWLPDYSDRDTGYRLRLHQDIIVPPERTRVFIQDGKVLPSAAFNQYELSCNLEVRDLSEQAQRIKADEFIITHVQRLIEEVAWSQPVMLAQAQQVAADIDASPSDIFLGWHLWLYSSEQPQVLRLTCRSEFTEPWNAYYPSVAQIQWVLGEVADLIMPAPALH